MRRYDRGHTFFYCDPPYWQTEGYGVPFEFDQYEQLAEFMRSCKGKVMVSINDHPDIRACFEGCWECGRVVLNGMGWCDKNPVKFAILLPW